MLNRLLNKFILFVGVQIRKSEQQIAQLTMPPFPGNPENLKIDFPRKIANPERIFLGNNVSIGPGSLIYAWTHYPTSTMRHPDMEEKIQQFDSKIVVGNNVTASSNLRISACSTILIGNDVMFASNISVFDHSHGLHTGDIPYKYQKLQDVLPIIINDGAWIGDNTFIMPGVTIGRNAVVGANSFVNNDVPDFCISAGTPATVVKCWNKENAKWERR